MNQEIVRTYEENVKTLKEKMQRGDFSLTPNESYILKKDETLSDFFKSLIIQKRINWNQSWEKISALDIDLISILLDEDEKLIDLELGILAARKEINDSFYFDDDFENNVNFLFPPDVSQSLMEEVYQRIISNPTTNETIWLSNNLTRRLLEEGRYEVFTLDCRLPDDVDEEYVLSKFPYNQYHSRCINDLLIKYYRSKEVDIATIINSGLADTLPMEVIFSMTHDAGFPSDSMTYLVNRILQETDFRWLDSLNFNSNNSLQSNPFDEEQKTKIIEHLKTVGRFDLAFILMDEVIVEKDSEAYRSILSSMQKGVRLRRYPENIDDLLQDDDFLDAFVTSGSIRSRELRSDTRARIVNRIFREIANGNVNYTSWDYNIRALMVGIDVNQLDFDFNDELFLTHVIEIPYYSTQEEIISILLEKDSSIIENLVNKKQYDIFFKICSLSPQDMHEPLNGMINQLERIIGPSKKMDRQFNKGGWQLSESSQKQLIEAIKQNYTYLEDISISLGTGKNIWQNPILLQALLYFPTIRNQLSVMVSQENFFLNFCSEETYEGLKIVLEEFKEYNTRRLDALKERLGVNVIRNLNDEGLAMIFGYDDQKFNRLLAFIDSFKGCLDIDTIIQYLENQTIIAILDYDDKKFNRLLTIIKTFQGQIGITSVIQYVKYGSIIPILDYGDKKFSRALVMIDVFKEILGEGVIQYLSNKNITMIFDYDDKKFSRLAVLIGSLKGCINANIITRRLGDENIAMIFDYDDKKFNRLIAFIDVFKDRFDANIITHLQDENIAVIFNYDDKKFNRFIIFMETFKEQIAVDIMQYMEDKNIATILDYDDQKFHRLLDLFSQKKMTIDQLRDAYDSIVQYGFPRACPGVVDIFNRIMISLQNGNDIELMPLFTSLPDSKFDLDFRKEYPNITYSSCEELLKIIIEKIKANKEDRNYYTDMLHFITDYYIKIEREKYRAAHDMRRDLALTEQIDVNDAKSKLPRFLIEKGKYQEELIDFLLKKGIAKEELVSLLKEQRLGWILLENLVKDFANRRALVNELLIKNGIDERLLRNFLRNDSKEIINLLRERGVNQEAIEEFERRRTQKGLLEGIDQEQLSEFLEQNGLTGFIAFLIEKGFDKKTIEEFLQGQNFNPEAVFQDGKALRDFFRKRQFEELVEGLLNNEKCKRKLEKVVLRENIDEKTVEDLMKKSPTEVINFLRKNKLKSDKLMQYLLQNEETRLMEEEQKEFAQYLIDKIGQKLGKKLLPYLIKKEQNGIVEFLLEKGLGKTLVQDLTQKSSAEELVEFLKSIGFDNTLLENFMTENLISADRKRLERILEENGITISEKSLEEILRIINQRRTMAMECIQDYVSPEKTKDTKKVKIFHKFESLIPTFFEQIPEEERQQYYEQMEDVKRVYDVPESSTDFLRMILSLKLEHVSNILEDEVLYESLKQHLGKSLAAPDVLLRFMAQPPANLDADIYNLYALISYYSEIYNKNIRSQDSTSDVSLSFINIMRQAETYAATSNIYALILGVEDARLIKSNPPDNAARRKLANNGRLRESITWLRQNYERTEVTVPTFNTIFNIRNAQKSIKWLEKDQEEETTQLPNETPEKIEAKSLQVIVGNFTNPCNLTHGERTDACMRIGGVGEGLFQFCLADRNGFHIRFQDPKTGEYISRVSGFRNGNTVFLNELRHSCNPQLYSDADVIYACLQAARQLIDSSKDSSYPIDNVVVLDEYAAEKLRPQDLGVDNVRKGLTLSYCDVGRYAVVLATSRTDNKLVPINFDQKDMPIYPPARDNIIKAHSTREIIPYIRRIYAIESMRNNVQYEYLEFPMMDENEVSYGFANQDWYLYVDKIGVIHEKIITDDPRAKEELESARKLLQAYIPEKGVNPNYGL